MQKGHHSKIPSGPFRATARRRGGNRRKSDSQVGIHLVLPSPPSDVFVFGLPYVRCLFFQRSSQRCYGRDVPRELSAIVRKTLGLPRTSWKSLRGAAQRAQPTGGSISLG
jgi:hypothetical protein